MIQKNLSIFLIDLPILSLILRFLIQPTIYVLQMYESMREVMIQVPGSPIRTLNEEIYNGIDRDTGNEIVWRLIKQNKRNKSKNMERNFIVDLMTSFLNELERAVKLECKNLVKYIYCERRFSGDIVLITEATTSGSLDLYLRNYRNPRPSILSCIIIQASGNPG